MGGVYEPELMKKYVAIGARLILAGNDITFLMQSARRQAATVREMLG
jgi:2-keto-3-deoxy-L-rhamnonate aldolase RhmA